MGIVQNWSTTVFPANLDSVAGSFPALTDLIHDVVASHPNSLAGAVCALEAKVGIDDSAVATSFDYVLKKGRHTSKQPGGSTGSVAFVLDALNAHSGTDKLLSLRSATNERFAVGGGGATDTYWELGNGQAVGVGPAGKVRFRFDGATNKAQVSENGGAWTDIAGSSVQIRSLPFNDAVIGVVPLVIGSIYLYASTQLLSSCRAMLGTQAGGTATVRLRRFSTGVLVAGATWAYTGVGMSGALIPAPVTTPAADDWYDIELVGDVPATVAIAKGLHLEITTP